MSKRGDAPVSVSSGFELDFVNQRAIKPGALPVNIPCGMKFALVRSA